MDEDLKPRYSTKRLRQEIERARNNDAQTIAALEAQLAEMTRRRDEWRAKAEGYDEVRLALRKKVGTPWPPNMSRALWAGIAADEKKRADDAEARLSALKASPPAPKVTEAMVKAGHAAMMSELSLLCQPNRGDVFSFMDDHPELIEIAITAAQESGE